MKKSNFFRTAFTMMAAVITGMPVVIPTRRNAKRVYRMVTVENTVTGKEVQVPAHNVEYFLSRRTDRWRVQS